MNFRRFQLDIVPLTAGLLEFNHMVFEHERVLLKFSGIPILPRVD